jgi:hypothetical protein
MIAHLLLDAGGGLFERRSRRCIADVGEGALRAGDQILQILDHGQGRPVIVMQELRGSTGKLHQVILGGFVV